MTDVDWLVGSVIVGDQGTLDRGVDVPVEPDPSGQGEQPLGDPGPEALDGVRAVAFQAKLVCEGVEDGLDPLADPTQGAEPVRLITAVGAGQDRTQVADDPFELAAGQPLVGQHHHAGSQEVLVGGPVQQHLGDLPLAVLGVGQAPADRHAVRAGQHIQLEPQYQRLWLGS
jgi:hypothetical protein